MRGEPTMKITCDGCKSAAVVIPAPKDDMRRQYSGADYEIELSLKREGWTVDVAGREICDTCSSAAKAA